MSQYDTPRAALRLEKAGSTATIGLASSVERSSIWGSSGWAVAINGAGQFTFKDNVIYETHRNAYKVEKVTTMSMLRNLFMYNDEREFDSSLKLKDHQVAVDLCRGEFLSDCTGITVQNNVLAGGKGLGWLMQSGDCDNESGT